MSSRRPLRTGLGILAVTALLAGCGAQEPPALEPLRPAAPADLCTLVPASARSGLVASSSSDPEGEPTAACSLRSPEGSQDGVRALVTWVQLDDGPTALDAYESQCRAVDTTQLGPLRDLDVAGADRGCAAAGTPGGEGSATLSAVADRDLVTVRLTSSPGSATAVGTQAQTMLEGVLRGLTADP